MTTAPHCLLFAAATLFGVPALSADWPTVRGNAARTGYVDADLKPPFRVAWARYFVGERIGSAVEPIVAEGKVFIGTHSGNLYALDAVTGDLIWRSHEPWPILHSPAYANGAVMVPTASLMSDWLDAGTGKTKPRQGSLAGGSSSPLLVEGKAYLGSRYGIFSILDPNVGLSGEGTFAPVRQTAASADGKVFFTGEDMRVRAYPLKGWPRLWTSEPLVGQTARDYYPVIAKAGGRTVVIVRTNPVIQFSQLIGRDRRFLCQQAGADDSDWRKLDAWQKSEKSVGTLDLWEKEQAAIVRYLGEHRDSQTFFVLDAETGKLLPPPPVLWAAGCQGVGTPPVVLPDGKLLVYYRSAYGNWTHGVAPMVALGLLDLEMNRIEPLRHANGAQPPWNTFWGTADESQNFVVAGKTVLIVHQSTLSGFDLETKKLFPIAGERDSWGGFRNLPWARNEWNGPARSGVAVVGNRIYWQTGSRVLCIVAGEKGERAKDVGIETPPPPAEPVSPPNKWLADYSKQVRLTEAVSEALLRAWAPLYVEPGLAGREFCFDQSGEVFDALAWAFPNLEGELKDRTKTRLASQWDKHPPFTKQAWYPLDQGERREYFPWVPKDALTPLDARRRPHPFGNMNAIWLYAERCGEWDRVKTAWPGLKACYEDFAKSNWKLDPAKGDLHANRYLAALIAFERIAEKAGDAALAAQAKAKASETADALVAWWQRVAEKIALPVIKDIGEWDRFIHEGDVLFLRVTPHNSKIALFHGLTPEVAALVKAKAPEAVEKVWRTFEALCPTWYLMGEERQVHFGENFVDPPDFALGAFQALAWLRGASREELLRRVDIPFCRADLSYIGKLALALEAR